MDHSDVLLFIIKLVLGGLTAFFAIMLWSRTRDAAWMALVAGAVTSYAGIVYEMMAQFGILAVTGFSVFGIPLATLLFTVIPPVFFITAFITMIARTRTR